MYRGKILTITTIILSLILIGAGCTGESIKQENQNQKKSQADTKSRAAQSKVKKVEVGTSLSNGYLTLNLLQAKRVDSYERGGKSRTAPKNKDFLLLKVKYKNDSDIKIEYDNLGWNIYNYMKKDLTSTGPTPSAPLSPSGKVYGALYTGERMLKPGTSVVGWMQFRIPEKLKDISMSYDMLFPRYDFNNDGSVESIDDKDYEPILRKAVWSLPELQTKSKIKI